MSSNTKIQWCDSTCNPTMGCDGCELWTRQIKKCYAGTLHVRFGRSSKGYASTFENVTTFPGRMENASRWSNLQGLKRNEKPWLNGMARLIFVSDMSDSLSSKITFEYLLDEIVSNAKSPLGSRHHWLWLTKRPERMAKFSVWLSKNGIEWPTNLWAGTSVTSQKTTSRIKHLSRVGNNSTIRFLSVEPQYENIDLTTWLPKLDWVIQGGESGNGAAPFHIEWARLLSKQCHSFGVPYFLKQLGSNVKSGDKTIEFSDGHAGDWNEWPRNLRIRKMPKILVKKSREKHGKNDSQSIQLIKSKGKTAA
ncbi:Phage protein Gp37/Gp68 [Gimesia panareensis]|uniref:Phage protein Gp37/Gp68 n=1 Tax=Gimesia panareensis TaxID=2527978 RepID=A0A518FXK3_9PLAN|nr:DUF5131 family protein [Gimesia panareensis]QDV21103.1 Phage protein Gp37/Gp68 [Gimesia panareensis]